MGYMCFFGLAYQLYIRKDTWRTHCHFLVKSFQFKSFLSFFYVDELVSSQKYEVENYEGIFWAFWVIYGYSLSIFTQKISNEFQNIGFSVQLLQILINISS